MDQFAETSLSLQNRCTLALGSEFAYPAVKSNTNRSAAIKWMKEVMTSTGHTDEVGETSFQIFDSFLVSKIAKNDAILLDKECVSLAAISSILLSCKIHSSSPKLTMANFQHFPVDELIASENDLLVEIDFRILPNEIPSYFVARLLDSWHGEADKNVLAKLSSQLIHRFAEEPEYLLFTPSTIAIAAVVLSFLYLGEDCTEWLRGVPDDYFPLEGDGGMDRGMARGVSLARDIDACLGCFRAIVYPNARACAEDGSREDGGGDDKEVVATGMATQHSGESGLGNDKLCGLSSSPTTIANDIVC